VHTFLFYSTYRELDPLRNDSNSIVVCSVRNFTLSIVSGADMKCPLFRLEDDTFVGGLAAFDLDGVGVVG
jgi:hypothetical protein